jgi:hypothetical protein
MAEKHFSPNLSIQNSKKFGFDHTIVFKIEFYYKHQPNTFEPQILWYLQYHGFFLKLQKY